MQDSITVKTNPHQQWTTYRLGECVVWEHDGILLEAWKEFGQACFPIHEHERSMSPADFINKVMLQTGHRCTRCKQEIKEEVKSALFAGRLCEPCFADHMEVIQEDYRLGRNICRLCSKSRHECYC